MAKITNDQRALFQEKTTHYKAKIEEYDKMIKKYNIEIMRDKSKEALHRYKISNLILNKITIYCSLNDMSMYLLDVKNSSFLEKARQQIYESLINLEKVVTNYIDTPFKDYAENLSQLDSISDEEKLAYVKKLGYAIELLKISFGDNSKWKWSFVEIKGRFAVIVKNLFDIRKFQKMDDPRQEGYTTRKRHLFFLRKLLYDSAQEYRERFALSTKNVDDLKKAILFLQSLMRISQLLGDAEKVENTKKQIEVWKTLLEKQEQHIEEQKRKKNLY